MQGYVCGEAFHGRLVKAGFQTGVRLTCGENIDAACGQLVGEFLDRTGRRSRE